MSNELVTGRYDRLPSELAGLVEPLRVAGASHYAVLRGTHNDRSQAGWDLGHTGNLDRVVRLLPVMHRAPGPEEIAFTVDKPIWTRKVGVSWLNDAGQVIGVSPHATIKVYGKYAKSGDGLSLQGEPRLTSLRLSGQDLHRDDRDALWNILNPQCPSPECFKRGSYKESEERPDSVLECSVCGYQFPSAPLDGRWLLFGLAGDAIFARAFSADTPAAELLARAFPKMLRTVEADKLQAITDFKSGVFDVPSADARSLAGGFGRAANGAPSEALHPAVSEPAPAGLNADERQVRAVANTIRGIGRAAKRNNDDLARLLKEQYETEAAGDESVVRTIDFIVLDSAVGSEFERRVIAEPAVGFFSEHEVHKWEKSKTKRGNFLTALEDKWSEGCERSLPSDERVLICEEGGDFLFTRQGADYPIVGWAETTRGEVKKEGLADLRADWLGHINRKDKKFFSDERSLAFSDERSLAERLTFVLVRRYEDAFAEAAIYMMPDEGKFYQLLASEQITYHVVFPESGGQPLESAEFRLPSRILHDPEQGVCVFEKRLEVTVQ